MGSKGAAFDGSFGLNYGWAMYIRTSCSQGRTYLRLVEGYRDSKGRTRQRQIGQLGRADELTAEKVQSLIRGLKHHAGMATAEDVCVDFQPSRSLGPTWLLTEIWRELGFDQALKRAFRSSYRHFDLEGCVRAMVFNRLCDPDSKLGVLRWLEHVYLPGVETAGWHHEQLMRAMDALLARREAVEDVVAGQLKPLLDQELSVVFYDITTVGIHGEHEVAGDLRRFGHSKDHGGVARQFALGVVQTADGLPIAHEVFEGNVAETATLAPMLRRLLQRFALKRVVVVADRGLLSLDNVATLDALGQDEGLAVDYILAVPGRRYGEFRDRMAQLHPGLADEAKRTGAEVVTESTWQGRRLVVSHNPDRAREQRRARRKRLKKVLRLGRRLAHRLDNQDRGEPGRGRRSSDRSAHRRFHKCVVEQRLSGIVKADLGAEQFRYDIDRQALADAGRMDGKLLLVTSLPTHEAETIVQRYRSLADIERGFRALKSTLEIAPVHHRLPERIRAHALICFLALVVYRVLRMRLKQRNVDYSVERALETLANVQCHQIELDGERVSGVSLPPEQRKLFEELEVSPPSRRHIA